MRDADNHHKSASTTIRKSSDISRASYNETKYRNAMRVAGIVFGSLRLFFLHPSGNHVLSYRPIIGSALAQYDDIQYWRPLCIGTTALLADEYGRQLIEIIRAASASLKSEITSKKYIMLAAVTRINVNRLWLYIALFKALGGKAAPSS